MNSGQSYVSFGGLWLVHSLQKSVWQQFQLNRAQLLSVVQPFSPFPVEEKKKNHPQVKWNTLLLAAKHAETQEVAKQAWAIWWSRLLLQLSCFHRQEEIHHTIKDGDCFDFIDLQMSHFWRSRPVWRHCCSPTACSWPSRSPRRSTRFYAWQLQHKHIRDPVINPNTHTLLH